MLVITPLVTFDTTLRPGAITKFFCYFSLRADFGHPDPVQGCVALSRLGIPEDLRDEEIHPQEKQEEIHFQKEQKEIHPQKEQEEIHFQKEQKEIHPQKKKKEIHSQKEQEEIHFQKEQKEIHPQKKQEEIHSQKEHGSTRTGGVLHFESKGLQRISNAPHWTASPGADPAEEDGTTRTVNPTSQGNSKSTILHHAYHITRALFMEVMKVPIHYLGLEIFSSSVCIGVLHESCFVTEQLLIWKLSEIISMRLGEFILSMFLQPPILKQSMLMVDPEKALAFETEAHVDVFSRAVFSMKQVSPSPIPIESDTIELYWMYWAAYVGLVWIRRLQTKPRRSKRSSHNGNPFSELRRELDLTRGASTFAEGFPLVGEVFGLVQKCGFQDVSVVGGVKINVYWVVNDLGSMQ
ncbi:unnamed protein product [Darwinula stevensoni]|uniref:Uncharacterized protein n=1 Tax=Darwinula stevensoni TaxID=69355 RepID=A0A7R8X7T3_9CRUS|nr:unnamed protein product [Darwinula stevensoni]CAG0889445.1 unnamed protein product [Darwinula stevensoni]